MVSNQPFLLSPQHLTPAQNRQPEKGTNPPQPGKKNPESHGSFKRGWPEVQSDVSTLRKSRSFAQHLGWQQRFVSSWLQIVRSKPQPKTGFENPRVFWTKTIQSAWCFFSESQIWKKKVSQIGKLLPKFRDEHQKMFEATSQSWEVADGWIFFGWTKPFIFQGTSCFFRFHVSVRWVCLRLTGVWYHFLSTKMMGKFYETTKKNKVVGWYSELIGGFNPFGTY